MSEALAARYATALVELVLGENAPLSPEQALLELDGFAALTASSADLRHILNSPAVSRVRKRAVLSQLAATAGYSTTIRNFLFVLVDRGRITMLPIVRRQVEEIFDARRGIARAQIASAMALSEAEQAAITGELSRISGKQIQGQFSVDPALLGGVVARIGSTVYDGSVRGKLSVLKSRLGA
ncbi:MAG: ATP synthase F1 subunit delta [Bryobacter sp.]|nr:ATP synthase F1 subunit delta [Bryobacter sp.]